MKIMTVVGARPQFIKAAVISRLIRDRFAGLIEELIVHTGQHFDHKMSESFFNELDIPKPYVNLGVSGGLHGAMTGKMLAMIEEAILNARPDVLLVYGDTNSTLAGALAAAKLHIPVAHVEAGLRSFNMRMPEEINRILTDDVSHWLFCPTEEAVNQLKKENKSPEKIHFVGDVMYDSVRFYREREKERPSRRVAHYLATIHRAENTDDPERMREILNGLTTLAEDRPVILPLHPRTRGAIANMGLSTGKIEIVEPVGYLEMLNLVAGASLVLTDSGGLQKEAAFLGKACVTLRDETEWRDLERLGFNILAGASSDRIIAAAKKLADVEVRLPVNVFGDGQAGQKILKAILSGR